MIGLCNCLITGVRLQPTVRLQFCRLITAKYSSFYAPITFEETLLLQTHAWQLYSLVVTQFCRNLESSTTNAWNAKNAIFSRASRVTFGPWIT